MNGFEKHGLNHTSASQINTWANAPCVWVARYLYGKKGSFGLAARAGILVEDAVVAVLTGQMSAEQATEQATKTYNKAAAIGASSAELKRGAGIPGMIELALAELDQYGTPEFDGGVINGFKQKRTELMCHGDGYSLPITGYIDFDYPQHGLTVDLKTTMAAPKNMSKEHSRQGAIYKRAMGNHAMKFLYVTPTKAVWHEIEDDGPILAEVKQLLNRQEKFLHLDKETIRDIIPVQTSTFYWTGDEEIREELYGL